MSSSPLPPPSTPAPPAPGRADPPLVVIRPWRTLSLDELAELWAYRELLGILAWRDVSIRYKQAAFGVAWALLQPAVQALLFTVLFHRIAGLSSGGSAPFAPFVLSGLVLWNLFSNGLSQASDSLVRNGNLISKVYFPRLIIPLASMLVPLIDFALALGLLLGLMAYHGLPLGPRALLAFPLAACSLAAAAGPGLALAALNVEFRDVRHALPFLLQVLLYAAPVFYPAEAVPERFRGLLDLNPMVPIIDAFRASLFGGPLPAARLALALGESLAAALLGLVYFRRFERTFADQL